MIRRLTNPQKGSRPTEEAAPVCPSGFKGSHWNTGQVTVQAARLRALYDALGPCFWRTVDGGSVITTAHALQIVDLPYFHEATQ